VTSDPNFKVTTFVNIEYFRNNTRESHSYIDSPEGTSDMNACNGCLLLSTCVCYNELFVKVHVDDIINTLKAINSIPCDVPVALIS